MPAASSKVALLAGAVAAAGTACVGYGVLVERDWYRLRRERVRALEPGGPPLAVLHLADLPPTGAALRPAALGAARPPPPRPPPSAPPPRGRRHSAVGVPGAAARRAGRPGGHDRGH